MFEFEFRGQRLDNKKWVYGGYHKHNTYTLSPIVSKGEQPEKPKYAYLIIQSGFSDWNLPKQLKGYEVDPATVGRYTGFRSNTKEKIYEKDFLRGKDFLGLVEWNEKNGMWIIRYSNQDSALLSDVNEFGEIIGNIYDNPELLW